jgi:hypothetical protein
MIWFSLNLLFRMTEVSWVKVFCLETSAFAWPYLTGWLQMAFGSQPPAMAGGWEC